MVGQLMHMYHMSFSFLASWRLAAPAPFRKPVSLRVRRLFPGSFAVFGLGLPLLRLKVWVVKVRCVVVRARVNQM